MKKLHANKTNILLVNITRLGDMLQATPTIAGMKEENPGSRVTVVVEKQFEDICHAIPHIDDVVSIDLGMTVRCLAREQDGIIDAYEYVSEFVDDLHGRKFDYCLNMSSSAYTALLLKLLDIGRYGGWVADDEGNRVIESEWARLFATSVFHHNRQFNSLNLVDVFRCSADVEQHPKKLLLNVSQKDSDFARQLIAEAGFTAKGPIIALQAGASQEKRQWSPAKFVALVKALQRECDARILLTGSKKELGIIEPIWRECNSPNIYIAAGKTSVLQLAALLKESDILITGDTGPMHVSVAVGTPVIAMFLASAFGFETGPYSEGNLILQPVIGCGPCNPNKSCMRPDCHDHMDPEALAKLTLMRLRSPSHLELNSLFDPSRVVVYRSFFDEYGFCDLQPLTSANHDGYKRYRDAYRHLWLEELGGLSPTIKVDSTKRSSLQLLNESIQGVAEVVALAEKGEQLISQLVRLIQDQRATAKALGENSDQLAELDREIEQTGFHFAPLGPVTRMFMFAKENLCGTEALSLASQMGGIYQDLRRRCVRLGEYYQAL